MQLLCCFSSNVCHALSLTSNKSAHSCCVSPCFSRAAFMLFFIKSPPLL
nr:MAG TPA: hypothetical protein [Caudoviricetes sp.]